MPRSEAQWWKLEDNVDRLNADVTKLKEEKKELVARNQQQEKELKKLRKEVAGHKGALRRLWRGLSWISLILKMANANWKDTGLIVLRSSKNLKSTRTRWLQ
ncbi:UNVERIFIED_CONTAM: hypothetical protein Slati_3839200 [Sesamum latifolium]|uniref:Uncharacterized protein n=1 Tax=Sesamum latifolium TaxID=2727402 RepID=A0AAW2TJX9_9LAMI